MLNKFKNINRIFSFNTGSERSERWVSLWRTMRNEVRTKSEQVTNSRNRRFRMEQAYLLIQMDNTFIKERNNKENIWIIGKKHIRY